MKGASVYLSVDLCFQYIMAVYNGCRYTGMEDICNEPIHRIVTCRDDVLRRTRGASSENLLTINPIDVIMRRPYNHDKVFSRGINKKNLISLNRVIPSETVNLATLNCRSLRANKNLIKPLISEYDIDFMCLTETWLCDNDIFIPSDFTPGGYILHRVNRVSTRGRDVAILCKDSFKAKVSIISKCKFNSFEHIIVSVSTKACSFRLACLYRPPSVSGSEFITWTMRSVYLDGNTMNSYKHLGCNNTYYRLHTSMVMCSIMSYLALRIVLTLRHRSSLTKLVIITWFFSISTWKNRLQSLQQGLIVG